MNPDTKQLELMESETVKALNQTSGRYPGAKELAALNQKLTALQVAEPHKNSWTTFTIGEQVEVIFKRDGKPYYRKVQVKNIHSDGMLLSAPHLNDSFFSGQDVTVKGEACRVGLITSKGMYVQGV